MALLDERGLRAIVARLAGIERPSASAGEREAAELIAAALRDAGAERVRLEDERAHGTYWWPTGAPVAVAALAGLALRGRVAPAVAGSLAAWAVADDLTSGRRWFRRLFLPWRTTVNVIAEVGPADAERTIVFVAHHDAAHTGLVFHPELFRAPFRRFPGVLEHVNTQAPLLWGAVGGPAAVALGALLGRPRLRRGAAILSAGYAAAMADIGLRAVVPGANDNLSGVAVVCSLAHSLAEDLPPGVRVVLVSTGSEESHQEGMRGFADRHFGSLPLERTHVIALDTVGSPRLCVLEGEGMVRMYEYPKHLVADLHALAREHGIEAVAKLRTRGATDGLVALKAGYATVALASVDEFKAPTHYHWPTDTADNVDYATVAAAARLCRAFVDRIGQRVAGETTAEATAV